MQDWCICFVEDELYQTVTCTLSFEDHGVCMISDPSVHSEVTQSLRVEARRKRWEINHIAGSVKVLLYSTVVHFPNLGWYEGLIRVGKCVQYWWVLRVAEVVFLTCDR